MLNNVEAGSKTKARLIKQFKNHETKIEYFYWNFSLKKKEQFNLQIFMNTIYYVNNKK